MGTSRAKKPHKYAEDIWESQKEVAGDGVSWGSEGRKTKKTKICSLDSGGMGRFLSDLVRYESWRDNVHGDAEVN